MSVSAKLKFATSGSALLTALLLLTPSAAAEGIIVVGDSWAEPLGEQLRIVLDESGLSGVSLETTPYWGGPRNLDSPEGRTAIAGWLERWPDASHVYLMMGQNNWLCCWTTAMIGTAEEAELFDSIVGHTGNVVDYMLSLRPELRFVWTEGEYFRPHHLGTPTEMNAKHDLLARLAAEFAAGRPELTYLDWNGHLQVAFGFNGVPYTEYDPDYAIPPGDPSLPDPTLPSPDTAFRNAAHPNERGYKALAQALYDGYLEAEFNGDGFRINPGLNDAWYDPRTAGQGFLLTVFPDAGLVFVAWFTFDLERPGAAAAALLGEPGHRWLTAQGPYEGDRAELELWVTQGGVFDAAEPVTESQKVGRLLLEFDDCETGTASYDLPAVGLAGSIPIQRLTPDNVALCEALSM